MAGTNAVVFKQALTARLQAEPLLEGIQVEYGAPGRPGEIERDCIYGGRTTFQHRPMAFKAGPRLPRKEDATATEYVYAYLPGGTQEEAEARAVDLGEVFEHVVASDPRLESSNVPGLLITTLAGGELIGGWDDDGAWALLTYRLGFQSQLT